MSRSQPNSTPVGRLFLGLFAFGLSVAACGTSGTVGQGAVDDATLAEAAGVLPISDDGDGESSEESIAERSRQWGAAPGPDLVPDVVKPPDGELVATALITEGLVAVWESPTDDEPTWSLAAPTEFGGDRHFLVLEETEDWLKIMVPVRPNESEGWIPREAVTLSVTRFRVQVDISDRSMKVWEGEELLLDTTTAVGRSSAPTPLGFYYIRDVLPWDPDSVYGPYVLALSAYSETIDQINGGDAVVAIHGTSRPSKLGTAASLGCIRLSNDDVIALAELVPVGTPVEVVA